MYRRSTIISEDLVKGAVVQVLLKYMPLPWDIQGFQRVPKYYMY